MIHTYQWVAYLAIVVLLSAAAVCLRDVRVLLWVKRRLFRDRQYCELCAGRIPEGKSAWYDKLIRAWVCRHCAPNPW